MKKAQLTMLIIVGLVLFVLVGMLLYLSKAQVKRQSDSAAAKSQQSSIENLPFKDHVAQCLDKSAKQAIDLLGRQGGYIFTSQGGNIIDYLETDLGILFLEKEGNRISYNIYPLKTNIQKYYSQAPHYPWQYFPYENRESISEVLMGVFGLNSMPPLYSNEGPSSMQSAIESYVENNVPKCIDVASFREQGYRITLGRPRSKVIIGSKDVLVVLNMPITVANPTTEENIELDEFSFRYNLRLRDMYIFTKSLISNDVSDIMFDVQDQNNFKNGFSVQVLRDVLDKDDVITIYDQKSLLDGKSLQYTFARKNRAPALYLIRNDLMNFPPNYLLKRSDILATALEAKDPDEDSVSFRIRVNEQDLTEYVLDVPELDIMIEASDGALMDHQIIKVVRT